jgi:hypothetical protein
MKEINPMEHTRETTSAAFKTEPADGTTLVLKKTTYYGEPEWEVIWRDDKQAARTWDDDARGQHWFRVADEDPMELHQYLKYADAVFALGEEVARFDGDEEGDDQDDDED